VSCYFSHVHRITVKYSREVDATDEDIERTRADLRARLRQLQEQQEDNDDGKCYMCCVHSVERSVPW
jgi:hypothetical protein